LKKLHYLLLVIFFTTENTRVTAQELNCKVQVILNANTTSINQKVFKSLEKSVSDFMNMRKWTDETTDAHKKITCYLTINITDASKENAYTADFTVQSERPVFNSTYSTQLIRHKDRTIPFEYIENQALDYSDNAFFSNLTAALAFYANYIIAMDNDSYSSKAGQASLDKCQTICNLIPPNLSIAGSAAKGWQANEAQDISGQQTRIGIALASLNSGNDKFRNAIYKYHISGLDVLESDPKRALDEIELSIKDVYEMPSKHYIFKHFVLTKVDEIISLFSTESINRKKKIAEMLVTIEPTVIDKVNKGLN
jgi:hypothetical protein